MQKHWITNMQRLCEIGDIENKMFIIRLVVVTHNKDCKRTNSTRFSYFGKIKYINNEKIEWHIYNFDDALIIPAELSDGDLGYIKDDIDENESVVYIITGCKIIPNIYNEEANFVIKQKNGVEIANAETARESKLLINALQANNIPARVTKIKEKY